jgi:hypothetical protein
MQEQKDNKMMMGALIAVIVVALGIVAFVVIRGDGQPDLPGADGPPPLTDEARAEIMKQGAAAAQGARRGGGPNYGGGGGAPSYGSAPR